MATHSAFTNGSLWLSTLRSRRGLVFTMAALLLAGLLGVVVPFVGLAQLSWVVAGVVGIAGAVAMLAQPGIAFALYMFVGTIKADPVLSKLVPFDLTAVVVGLLVLACVLRLIRSPYLPYFPRSYGLYAAIVLPMLASLLYTPVLSVGADKTLRFLLLTGVGIVSPFLLLDSQQRVRVFLYSAGVVGLVISAESLTYLGGSDRLAPPGSSTISLGTAAGTGIAIAWSLALPELPLPRRILFYPAIGACFVALLGSGARGPMIGVVCCVLFALWKFRRLMVDVAILTGAGVLGLARVGIPEASLMYLATLVNGDPGAAMASRNTLMVLAWELFQKHPVLGVGIGGYQYYQADPENTFPHNIFLEISCEMGIIPVLAFTGLLIWAFWEAVRQLKDRDFPFWQESFAVLSFLIFGFLQVVKSGDINDNRPMWFAMALPFVLRYLANKNSTRAQEPAASAATA